MTRVVVEGETTRETLRDTTRVWLRTVEGRDLVFHDIHTRGYWTETYCGVSTVWRYADEGYDRKGTQMPLRHARKIGRPCRRCWP